MGAPHEPQARVPYQTDLKQQKPSDERRLPPEEGARERCTTDFTAGTMSSIVTSPAVVAEVLVDQQTRSSTTLSSRTVQETEPTSEEDRESATASN